MLLVNDPALAERARVIWDKGTNRASFLRGEVDRYTWVDVGSSFGASDLTAAFLLAQLEAAEEVTARRRAIWERYHDGLRDARGGGAGAAPGDPRRQPSTTATSTTWSCRARRRAPPSSSVCAAQGIATVFHFVPLHSSPAGERFCRVEGSLAQTEEMAGRLVRLPLFADLGDAEVERVVEATRAAVVELT